MSEIIIQAENISKCIIWTIGSGSLRRDMQHWWDRKIFNKQDPNQYIMGGEKIDNNEFVWALKNIDFELKQGEALGILEQWCGKIYIIKILSRIIKPTEGIVRGRGRISSLLVGTVSCRSHWSRKYFISGHILGMKKSRNSTNLMKLLIFLVSAFIDTPCKKIFLGNVCTISFCSCCTSRARHSNY
jgi:lipopolysaccharide transport system ATP-binding protein